MKIDELKGCFANITDDELLRDNGNLYAENKELKQEIERLNNIINELALLFDDYMSFVEVLEKYNYKLKGSDKE